MFIFFTKELEVPYYEECSFGYYEWFAKRVESIITVQKVPIPNFCKITSDYDYELEIKYLPELTNKENYLSRYDTYELVEKYWKNNYHTDYMRIKVEIDGNEIKLIPYTSIDYKLELNKSLENLFKKNAKKNDRKKLLMQGGNNNEN